MSSISTQRLGVLACAALAVGGADAAAQHRFYVRNDTSGILTFSDLFEFTQKDFKGTKTERLRKGHARDDVKLERGETVGIPVSPDAKSYTVSYLNKEGKEVEANVNFDRLIIEDKDLAFFDAPQFEGLYAIAYADGGGLLPPEGYEAFVEDGRLPDPAYEWISFYETTSSDGFIVYDDFGYPLSPPLDGVLVSMAHHAHISTVPAPGVMLVGALGCLMLGRRGR